MPRRLLAFPLACCALLGACAPVYLPSAASVPMLRARRETHVAALAVPAGVQVNAAHAVTDRWTVRATGHAGESERKNSRYKLVSFGGSYRLGEPEPDEWAAAAGLEAGGGDALGKLELFTTKIVHSGSFLRAAGELDLAREWEYGALGFAARLVYFRLAHDASSRVPGLRETWWFGEPVVLARVGPRKLRLEGQFGVSLPLYRSESNISGFLPAFLSLGLTTNF